MITKLLNKLIDITLNSDKRFLNEVGNKLHVYTQMKYNKDNFIYEEYNYSSNKNRDLFKEIQYLINGKYSGNKEYLFARLNYLVDEGIKNNPDQANMQVRTSKKVVRFRNKKGQFIKKAKCIRKKSK